MTSSRRRAVAAALAVAVTASGARAQLPAFPGAEGAGAFAVGGRISNNVYVVTNLNDSGDGSLRYGLQTAPSSGRMIVFGVSGTINLVSDLVINKPYVTIAGQTAPEGGITLARRMVRISNTHNVILQHVNIRPGDFYTAPDVYEPDALWISGSNNVIVDHVSASWSTDEVLSVSHGSTNVTVQWSLITEALHNSNHSKGNHGYGSIIHGGETTLHHNLYANNRSRNPATGNWDKTAPITPAHLDIVNNVISNPGDRYSYSGGDDQYDVNYVGNFGVEGPNTTRKNELFHPDNVNSRVYYAGNYYDNSADGILQLNPAAPSTLTGTYTSLASPATTTNPPTIVDAPTAYMQVLSYAGASAWRDPIDKRVINDVINQSGAHIDSQNQVGGWYNPIPKSHALGPDGLPGWWKTAQGFSPTDNTVGLQFAPDGYTYLEKYLHELNAPYMPPAMTVGTTISTAIGAGADAQIGENSGIAGGNGSGAQLNARWTGSGGASNELVLLRFDLDQIRPGTVTSSALELTAFRNMASHTLRVYGLKHEVLGQDWDESTVTFADAPGVTFDGNSGTRSLNTAEVLLLGQMSTAGALEGDTISFANPDLAVFLNTLAYREDGTRTVTLLLERQDNSSTQTRFASKEATSLQSGEPVEAGTYAPRLVLNAALDLAGDFNADDKVDAQDLQYWNRGFGLADAAFKLQGDGNGDARVDGSDFLAWQRQWSGAPAAAQFVPEPAAYLLAAWGLLLHRTRAWFANKALNSGIRDDSEQ
ncbi:MAG: DNRLRE domain-containing protein [Pirellulales bacterium]|nr:DNRLRE domain-containing protein [Pirellulales bacterium]